MVRWPNAYIIDPRPCTDVTQAKSKYYRSLLHAGKIPLLLHKYGISRVLSSIVYISFQRLHSKKENVPGNMESFWFSKVSYLPYSEMSML